MGKGSGTCANRVGLSLGSTSTGGPLDQLDNVTAINAYNTTLAQLGEQKAFNPDAVLNTALNIARIGSSDDDTTKGYREERYRRFAHKAFGGNTTRESASMYRISDDDAGIIIRWVAGFRDELLSVYETAKTDTPRPSSIRSYV